MMGMIGVALNGVAIFNALDDAGRDAVAHEVQDLCNGHPQMRGEHHYHGPREGVLSGSGFEVPGSFPVLGSGVRSGFGVRGPRTRNLEPRNEP